MHYTIFSATPPASPRNAETNRLVDALELDVAKHTISLVRTYPMSWDDLQDQAALRGDVTREATRHAISIGSSQGRLSAGIVCRRPEDVAFQNGGESLPVSVAVVTAKRHD